MFSILKLLIVMTILFNTSTPTSISTFYIILLVNCFLFCGDDSFIYYTPTKKYFLYSTFCGAQIALLADSCTTICPCTSRISTKTADCSSRAWDPNHFLYKRLK
jgi:hypothetical protein